MEGIISRINSRVNSRLTLDNFGDIFSSLTLPEFQDELEAWDNQVNAARSDEATHPEEGRLF